MKRERKIEQKGKDRERDKEKNKKRKRRKIKTKKDKKLKRAKKEQRLVSVVEQKMNIKQVDNLQRFRNTSK